jgi:DNA-binding IclR family transcriptional regulator
MPEKDKYTIDILDVALDVIEYMLKSGGESQKPSEIAAKLNFNRTRVFRILKTLEYRGYVTFDPENQGYHLGLKFLEFSQHLRQSMDLRTIASPILFELAQTTGDSSQLLIRHGNHAITIDRYQGHNRLQVSTQIGQIIPLHVGASPKILLAYTPKVEREQILKKLDLTPYTTNTITDIQELRACLHDIRANGYAVDWEDYEIGVYAIGAPVRNDLGEVVAGITVTTPEIRFNPERCEELITQVIEAAKQISVRLGCDDPVPKSVK